MRRDSSSRRLAAVLALASVAVASPAASASLPPQRDGVHTFSLGKRGRTFADENGVFNPKLFAEDYDHVSAKYRHGNARYKRNLAEGKIRKRAVPSSSGGELHPVHDIAKRQSSSGGGSSGSVELIDGELGQGALGRHSAHGASNRLTLGRARDLCVKSAVQLSLVASIRSTMATPTSELRSKSS